MIDWFKNLFRKERSTNNVKNYQALEAQRLIHQCEGESDWIYLSRHRNGFVREVAVRTLSENPSAEALTAILERLNDWVPVIREVAANTLEAYLSTHSSGDLLKLLTQLISLSKKERVDHSKMVKRIQEVLVQAESINETKLAFATSRGDSARFLFSTLWPVVREAPIPFLLDALGHPDTTVRQQALQRSAELRPEDAIRVLEIALDNSNSIVRSRALYAWLPLANDRSHRIETSLLDASPGVRSVALWASKKYRIDPRVVLERRVKGTPPNRKIEWLGVLGLAKQIDSVLISPLLSDALKHPAPTVRAIALELSDQGHEVLLAALDDPATRVVKLAGGLLHEQPWEAISEHVTHRLEDWHSLPELQRKTLFALLPKWQQLDFLMSRVNGTGIDAYWLRTIVLWTQEQYQVVDPITPKLRRNAILGKLQEFELSGLIPVGSVHRLS
ncbi:HEAT repeat domain-containing protein [Pseudomonas panipatensis]|uniref:HEAT repeat domain-containing protein n=1 Tax=Pseudomonas panipatensis TaxID=428992 RepID=UPI0035B47A5F